MDGVDIDSVSLSQLRGKVGVVFHDTYVLNGTIRDKIGFRYYHEEETETNIVDIIHAAKGAQIHDFIPTLSIKRRVRDILVWRTVAANLWPCLCTRF
jgi:ABC-type multidrug transport system fused ATPase/permease subunit